MDWPGHGRSGHRSRDATYAATDLPWYAAEAARWLGWSTYGVVGHSMGAAAATMLAASQYPSEDTLAAACCVELLGPLSRPVALSAEQLKQAMLAREKSLRRLERGKVKEYESFEACVAARLRSLQALPGTQRLHATSAQALCERGAEEAEDGTWLFLHDVRLHGASPQYYTEEQVLALLQRIACPTLLIESDPAEPSAWPKPPRWSNRKAAVRNLRALELPGGHHLHLDPDTAPAVAAAVAEFLQEQSAHRPDWCDVELRLD